MRRTHKVLFVTGLIREGASGAALHVVGWQIPQLSPNSTEF